MTESWEILIVQWLVRGNNQLIAFFTEDATTLVL